MAQTKVNEYFSARKSTMNGIPSKRRKLNLDAIDVDSGKQCIQTTSMRSTRQTRAQRSKAVALKVSSTKPSSISTTSIDDHSQRLRKTKCSLVMSEAVKPNITPVTSPSKVVSSPLKSMSKPKNTTPMTPTKVLSSPSKSEGQAKRASPVTPSKLLLSPSKADGQRKSDSLLASPSKLLKSPVKSNNWVNEQAKNILFSRGSALLKASLENSGNQKANLACEQMALSLADHQFKTSPNKPKDIPIPVSQKGRARLRNKFSHLLERCEDNQEQEAPLPSKVTETLDKTAKPARASDKFKHLTTKEVEPSLKLPEKFKHLAEAFKCVDSILFLLNQRSETCTFERLQQSVQQMSGKSFTTKHLAMMKTVLPNGFTFRQEKGLHLLSGGKCNGYQLTIDANFKEFSVGSSGKLSSTALITRRLAFENNLLEIVKKHHQKFIRKLNLDIPDSQIHRWHPNFKLDDTPDVELSSLPKAPVVKTMTNAKDLLSMSKGNMVSKVQKALENVSDAKEITSSEKTNNAVPKKLNQEKSKDIKDVKPKENEDKDQTKNSNLKGVSSDLLERIRMKEQKKAEALMTMDPKMEHRQQMMSRLPEIVRILKSYFTAERKVAIASEDCVVKLQQSYGSAISLKQLEEHLQLLAELAPKWLTIATVRKVLYVKLNKNEDINNVINTLESRKKMEFSGR